MIGISHLLSKVSHPLLGLGGAELQQLIFSLFDQRLLYPLKILKKNLDFLVIPEKFYSPG